MSVLSWVRGGGSLCTFCSAASSRLLLVLFVLRLESGLDDDDDDDESFAFFAPAGRLPLGFLVRDSTFPGASHVSGFLSS